MEPSDAISYIETDIRSVLRDVLKGEYGFDKNLSAELQQRWAAEQKKRRPAVVTSDLLDYAHLGELKTIIIKKENWPKFADAFGNKTEFDVLMSIVIRYRNSVAHSRTLLPYERVHLEGIAGLIRTQVTRFRSEQSVDGKYYPIIESVTDSFGNEAKLRTEFNEPTPTGLKLRVGDVVTVKCVGTDPQGRRLTWKISRGPLGGLVDTQTGGEVTLRWTVERRDVAMNVYIRIEMSSDGEYHRHGTHDMSASFRYEVLPPGA